MPAANTRIRLLVIDADPAARLRFGRIFGPAESEASDVSAIPFPAIANGDFVWTLLSPSEDAVAAVTDAENRGHPASVVFVDVPDDETRTGRLEFAARLFAQTPFLQLVICATTASFDWKQASTLLANEDRWLHLPKPLVAGQALQMATFLARKAQHQRDEQVRWSVLEQRMAARTAELQAALEQIQRDTAGRARADQRRHALEKKLEELRRLESLGVLAGGIAHDFNNILTGITASASLARLDAPAGSELRTHLLRIEQSAQRATELCEQMLAYAGKSRGSLRPVNVNELVHEIRPLLDASIPDGAELTFHFGTNLPPLKADTARLRQVIMNLVANAAESLSGAVRQVSLSTAQAKLSAVDLEKMTLAGNSDPGDYLCISVSDTGVGIPADRLHRIFEPFYTTKFAGRGLGLSTVLGIVRSRDGCIDVQSTVGQGSVFRIYFPLAPKPLTASTPEPAAAAPSAPAAPLRGHLLVVDDEEPIRKVAASGLRRMGYQVSTAGSGAEAAAVSKQIAEPILGVLLDLSMPGPDGVATLTELRRQRPGIKAVLMSGYEEREALKPFHELGVDGFLQKPFTIEMMRKAVAVFSPEP